MTDVSYLLERDLFQVTQYPAGEKHYQFCGRVPQTGAVIEAHVRDFEGLCRIVTQDRILKRHDTYVKWFLPYFPFARHDRRNHAYDGFELGLALDLVTELDVVIADPHSDVSGVLPYLPQQATVQAVRRAGEMPVQPVFAIPDAGATKKAHTWIGSGPAVQCRKKRDVRTGNLSGFAVENPEVVAGQSVVIVDDICDAGGTFIGLAKELRAVGAQSVTLIVTHGLFTQGYTNLAEWIDGVISFTPTLGGDEDDTVVKSMVGSGRGMKVALLPYRRLYMEGGVV